MSDPLTKPPKGAMYLFDYARPPLKPDLYRLEVATNVEFDGKTESLQDESYFEVVGPRFSLPPEDIAGVFPPRNGHGAFHNSLAHIAIKRRTLPWERSLDELDPLGNPSDILQGMYPTPWLALLVFEENEYTLLQNMPLEEVLPKDVFKRIGSPANIVCDAVEADLTLLDAIMPSKVELQLLTHVRWVNVEDRELSAEGSDGWFSVVMGSRLPTPGKKCRACLVSLEERTDLVKKEPPPSQSAVIETAPVRRTHPDAPPRYVKQSRYIEPVSRQHVDRFMLTAVKKRLVLLHSWQFACEGDGTFFNLMQSLDVGMIGKVRIPGEPLIADTGHLRISLHDRGGSTETALYRGPLVPFELTRDALGPYHSADQCRRATPETGVEDISYAAAFEVGRLLAAADPRLAQELMRWRRRAFRQAARADTILALEDCFEIELPPALEEKLYVALPPILAKEAVAKYTAGAPPLADRYGLDIPVIGMDPKALVDAWGLASVEEAEALLGGVAAALGLEVPELPQTLRLDVTLADVEADLSSMQRLQVARERVLQNINVLLQGNP